MAVAVAGGGGGGGHGGGGGGSGSGSNGYDINVAQISTKQQWRRHNDGDVAVVKRGGVSVYIPATFKAARQKSVRCSMGGAES